VRDRTEDGKIPSKETIQGRSASWLENNSFLHEQSTILVGFSLIEILPDGTVQQDFDHHLVWDLMFNTFFQGRKGLWPTQRSVAHGIKSYHEAYTPHYESQLIPFVTYIPIEAIAMCFACVSSFSLLSRIF
jgi:hypothetical protein